MRAHRTLLAVVALVCGGLAVALWASPGAPAQAPGAPSAAPGGGDARAGRALFVDGCSTCHGMDARGIPGRAPSLVGAGAAAADFYLRTGRMPLPSPGQEPVRADPVYGERRIRDLVAYVGSLGAGPAIPRVDPAAGDLARGRAVFTTQCAGCHQVVGRGGIMPGGVAPALQEASATQIAEAVRVGPFLMPAFSERQLGRRDLDSVARYVLWTRSPADAGGWGIGNLGPIPEGMVAWLMAGVALLCVARLLGERTA
ncbi:MAG TPA: c-type cytochrome [Solirubrobacteraceae bacterium]|nr:c-type cytochrome [Solirubrobacteraceae bacterium]